MAQRQVAQFVGHSGTRREISKADQDQIVGTKGVGKEDLVWMPPNGKVDVTDLHEDVISFLKGDDEFTVKTVEVDDPESKSEAPAVKKP